MKILAIAPHPDDIEFGCGGTLLEYQQQGASIYLLTLTQGEFGGIPEERKKEHERSARYMKAKKLFWGGFTDTTLVADKNLILKIEEVLECCRPDLVFIPYYEDSHQDHRAAAQAAIAATRNIQKVLFYESPTSMHFEPDIFVDISTVLAKKIRLLKCHASQVMKTGIKELSILESAKACAIFRGYKGRVKFAEGFKALRVLYTF